MEIDYRYTRHQVPRGTRADAEDHNRLYLIKNVSELFLTYQIRLLAFYAWQSGRKLEIQVPRTCELRQSLKAFRREHPRLVDVKRFH